MSESYSSIKTISLFEEKVNFYGYENLNVSYSAGRANMADQQIEKLIAEISGYFWTLYVLMTEPTEIIHT